MHVERNMPGTVEAAIKMTTTTITLKEQSKQKCPYASVSPQNMGFCLTGL